MNLLHWLRAISGDSIRQRSISQLHIEALEDRVQPSAALTPPAFTPPVLHREAAASVLRPAERVAEPKQETAGPPRLDNRNTRAARPNQGEPAPGSPSAMRASVSPMTGQFGSLTRVPAAPDREQPMARAVDETLCDFMGFRALAAPATARPPYDTPLQSSSKTPASTFGDGAAAFQRDAAQVPQIPPTDLKAAALLDVNLGAIIASVSFGFEDELVSSVAQALTAREIAASQTAQVEPRQIPPWQTALATQRSVFVQAIEGLNSFSDVAAWGAHTVSAMAAPQGGLPVSSAPATSFQRAAKTARQNRHGTQQLARLATGGPLGSHAGGSPLADTVPDNLERDDSTSPMAETALLTALLRAQRQVRELELRQASYGQFFSPVIRSALRDSDPELLLSPREAEVTVLFGDLRGFSRQAEKHALAPFLASVSQALGVMTRGIREQEGVIGDFHGDATMGFWGWPSAQPDRAARAARTALSIRLLFAESGPAATPFRAGIGIASGRAIAGKIGTAEQVKVTVFGPVVNLASRLEGMTKIFGVAVLLDEATAQKLRESVGPEEARLRRLAVVLPYGMDRALTVSELLPPARQLPSLSDSHLAQYEAGLTAFLAGDWPAAHGILADLPRHDRAPEFLMSHMAERQLAPPADWDGIIRLASKS